MQIENEVWKIPIEFKFAPFFSQQSSFHSQKGSNILDILLNEPFYYDMLHVVQGKTDIAPWKNPKEFVPLVITQWKLLKGKTRETFKHKHRTQESNCLVIQCLALFIICLYWSNHRPVKGLNPTNMEITGLQRKPVNCEERLLFILVKPTQYHAFIQLEQLFDECEKSFSKAMALNEI